MELTARSMWWSGPMWPRHPTHARIGGEIDLAAAAAGRGRLVIYVYPRTGTPGEPLIEGWDEIPGARGCTPQSAAFRDHVTDFAGLGATVVGVSAQSPDEQAEFAAREAIPYPL